MPSHRDAKQRVSLQVIDQLLATHDYHRWSDTGLYCHRSNQNCEECPVYKLGIFHKERGYAKHVCKQPEANQLLLGAGKVPRLQDARIKG